jgi:hypothetical protein
VYELPSRASRRLLLSPISDILAFGGFLIACIFVFAGIRDTRREGTYIAIAAGLYLVVFVLRSFSMRMTADAAGIVVVNRFWRYVIPWENVSETIRATEWRTSISGTC